MCVEIKAITEALKWLCSTEEHQYATILTDSMSTLEKIAVAACMLTVSQQSNKAI